MSTSDTAGHAVAEPPDPPSGQATEQAARRRIGVEVWLVLGLSLGQSAVYSVISLGAKLTAGKPLASQTATLNTPQSVRPYLDLTYQLVGIAFTLMPVALAVWLLTDNGRQTVRQVCERLGIDRRRPWFDLAAGAGLAALIGLPGIGLYVIGHALGITATVVPTALAPYWWTVPVLILQAVKNAVLEEVIVVGYLVSRLKRLRWPTAAVLAASAILRGSYHLYQGFGPFIGNAVMGLIFAEWYRRKGRVMPLIIAHSILDVVAFLGYLALDDLGLLGRFGLA